MNCSSKRLLMQFLVSSAWYNKTKNQKLVKIQSAWIILCVYFNLFNFISFILIILVIVCLIFHYYLMHVVTFTFLIFKKLGHQPAMNYE